MANHDDEFEKLISNQEWRGSETEAVTIPRWLFAVFCFTIPVWLLTSMNSKSGDIIAPIIFGLIIGGAVYYYFRHRVVFSSFMKQEKPLKQVIREHKSSLAAAQRNAVDNAPDNQVAGKPNLTPEEDDLWADIIAQLGDGEGKKKKK